MTEAGPPGPGRGEDGEQMSGQTQSPEPAGKAAAGRRGPSVWLRLWAPIRNTWRSLTSMRTALVLLFLLAIAAIPGALLPQRSLNEQAVGEYKAEHEILGPLFESLQMYEVFGSFWFTAIYVLLFVSLIGCITPRIGEFARALRTPPVRAPRRLTRLPHHRQGPVDGDVETETARARRALRGWRTTERTEPGGTVAISAERGYLREAGNLVFHIALVGVLVTVAAGKIFGYEGNVIIVADGDGEFCNSSPAAYDSFRAGLNVDGTALHPFCLEIEDFAADYLPNGQAEMFTSNIRYQAEEDLASGTWHDYRLRVNDPLRVDGARVYLQGHGFAPTFTVTFPNGETRTQTLQFVPEEAVFFLSSGAMVFDPPAGMYPTAEDARRGQIALEGLFAPTADFVSADDAEEEGTLLTSVAPMMNDPAVAIDVYRGDTGLDSGRSQSIFTLDQSMIDNGRLVKQDRVNLRPGESVELGDGTVLTFDDGEEWVNLQVSYDPAQFWVLVSTIVMMAGLLVSLAIRRRRVWIRIRPGEASGEAGGNSTVMEIGGLARTDHAGWGEEFDRLSVRLLGERSTHDDGADSAQARR